MSQIIEACGSLELIQLAPLTDEAEDYRTASEMGLAGRFTKHVCDAVTKTPSITNLSKIKFGDYQALPNQTLQPLRWRGILPVCFHFAFFFFLFFLFYIHFLFDSLSRYSPLVCWFDNVIPDVGRTSTLTLSCKNPPPFSISRFSSLANHLQLLATGLSVHHE